MQRIFTDKQTNELLADKVEHGLSFPGRLKTYRLRMRLSQKRMAEKLGIDPGTIMNWEKGKHKPAKIYRKMLALDQIFEKRKKRKNSSSGWFAAPSLQDSFILCFIPVYPGALGVRELSRWALSGNLKKDNECPRVIIKTKIFIPINHYYPGHPLFV